MPPSLVHQAELPKSEGPELSAASVLSLVVAECKNGGELQSCLRHCRKLGGVAMGFRMLLWTLVLCQMIYAGLGRTGKIVCPQLYIAVYVFLRALFQHFKPV